MKSVSSFLMFQGNDAEEAITFYTSLIEDSEITSITRYGADGPGKEGSVIQASFSLKGQSFMCIDSYVKHAFTFTPSFSIFLTCDSEEEVDRLFEALSTSGSVLMPLGEYPFAKRFGWLNDRFGISWQLSLPNA
ncbi:VOC family protein [Paenibacillus lupini]|uniref:VOC family protein n=1 Tax=Paenibacillus lupini TaxID=1450204 RepID=UPI00141FA2B9|nr:VOC family protein [Paenibacillus lupini]NIK24523.1 putative 3-demethylubiquinone-9 3-methyltransferase (glyoxalase superfamily) [Paenibacillus lupini]